MMSIIIKFERIFRYLTKKAATTTTTTTTTTIKTTISRLIQSFYSEGLVVLTDGRRNGRTDGWRNGRTDGWRNGRLDERTDGRTDGQTEWSFFHHPIVLIGSKQFLWKHNFVAYWWKSKLYIGGSIKRSGFQWKYPGTFFVLLRCLQISMGRRNVFGTDEHFLGLRYLVLCISIKLSFSGRFQ